MPFNIGVPELLLILLIFVLIFGVGKLPELGSALGKGIREFRSSVTGLDEPKEIDGDRKKKPTEDQD